ncbi:MAG: cyclic nucleotide-binding domain-containing protein [Bacteroidota bacterium]
MPNERDIHRFFQVFFDYVRLLIDIPEGDQEICKRFFKPVFVKKDTILEKAGQVHNHLNFIVSGYMRNYHINEAGEEIVSDINDGPRFFASYNHYINRTPSHEYLHCITDCELLRISRDDSDLSAQLGQTQMEYNLLILQESLEEGKQRSIDFSTLSAEERYHKLAKNHPRIIQNIPLKYIASYIGINPGSLSRIRKNGTRSISSQM